jgi:hypothetical protein
MRGHNYNFAVNGTTVDNIEFQLQRLLGGADPLPDVLIVQTIDNDMRCDGTDPENWTDRDVAADLNHLPIEGHAKMAAIAWKAFPADIKVRD